MRTSKFDIADYLDSKEMIAEYLNTVLEEGNNADIINAIGYIAKAIGMTKISEETGLSRPSLYKALSNGAKPQFATIMKVLKAIGGRECKIFCVNGHSRLYHIRHLDSKIVTN